MKNKLLKVLCFGFIIILSLNLVACGERDAGGLGNLSMDDGSGGSLGTLGVPIEGDIGDIEDTEDTENTEDTEVNSSGEYNIYSCATQDFSFLCEPNYSIIWDDANGATVYTETVNSIPYVLVYSSEGQCEPEDYFTDFTQAMQTSYGSDLTSIGELQNYTIGTREVPGVMYTYNLQGTSVVLFRVLYQTNGRKTEFTCKYVQDAGDSALGALALAVSTFEPDAAYYSSNATGQTEPPTTQTPTTEGTTLTTEKYECSYFSTMIPTGWQVTYDVVDAGGGMKRIYVFVQDPNDKTNMFFFVQAMEPLFVSEEAKQAWLPYMTSMYQYAPVLTEATAEATLKIWPSVYQMMQAEGIISNYFQSYTLQQTLGSKIESSNGGNTISYVLGLVSVPNKSSQYLMFYENSLLLMDPPSPISSTAQYYISYSNNGVVINYDLAGDQFDIIQSCLLSMDFSGYADSNASITSETKEKKEGIDISEYID